MIIIVLTGLLFSCNNSSSDKSDHGKTVSADTTRAVMSDSAKADIIDQIHILTKSGFYDKEDIFIHVEEYLYEIPADTNWIKQQIDMTYSSQLKEQASWPAITDFDKLANAFDQLNLKGIIAIHNAGITAEDGEDDSRDIYDSLLLKGIKAKGFCYYHWQDVERVEDDGHLYIGFGDFNDNEKEALKIGKQIKECLEKQGFKLNWDNTAGTRIEITNIKWQKRFGRLSVDHRKTKV
jgi:hypothetical protein